MSRDVNRRLRIDRVQRIIWCKAKYPYTKECWAAAHGRIPCEAACVKCDLYKG